MDISYLDVLHGNWIEDAISQEMSMEWFWCYFFAKHDQVFSDAVFVDLLHLCSSNVKLQFIVGLICNGTQTF